MSFAHNPYAPLKVAPAAPGTMVLTPEMLGAGMYSLPAPVPRTGLAPAPATPLQTPTMPAAPVEEAPPKTHAVFIGQAPGKWKRGHFCDFCNNQGLLPLGADVLRGRRGPMFAGFVQFATYEEAELAVERLHGTMVEGRAVQVRHYEKKE